MEGYYVNYSAPEDESYDKREWRLKRKEILLRDGFECQKCGNERLKEKSKLGTIISVSNHRTILGNLNRTDPLFYREAYKIVYEDDRGKKYTQKVLSHLKTNEYTSFKGLKVYLCTIRDKGIEAFYKDSINMLVTDTIINCIENPNSNSNRDKCFFVRNLHIHHLNYPDDDNIANVANKDLITLCARCHQDEHPHRNLADYCD